MSQRTEAELDLEYVPTVAELAQMNEGYAVAIKWDKEGNATMWRTTILGHDYLGAIMRRNAEKMVAAGLGDWVEPPGRRIPGLTT